MVENAAGLGTTTMNEVNSAELQSVLAADLNRAMLEAQARTKAEKELPTLTKAELAELLFEQVGLNKREAKDIVETFFDEIPSCVINRNAPAAIQKPAKKFRLRHAVS